ncbi:MAG TPA: Hsp20 family protein [Chryseosolibacter sp.]
MHPTFKLVGIFVVSDKILKPKKRVRLEPGGWRKSSCVGTSAGTCARQGAAPGMNRDDFKVELDNNFLTISSEVEQKNENTDERDGYTRREFSYQSFQRLPLLRSTLQKLSIIHRSSMRVNASPEFRRELG